MSTPYTFSLDRRYHSAAIIRTLAGMRGVLLQWGWHMESPAEIMVKFATYAPSNIFVELWQLLHQDITEELPSRKAIADLLQRADWSSPIDGKTYHSFVRRLQRLECFNANPDLVNQEHYWKAICEPFNEEILGDYFGWRSPWALNIILNADDDITNVAATLRYILQVNATCRRNRFANLTSQNCDLDDEAVLQWPKLFCEIQKLGGEFRSMAVAATTHIIGKCPMLTRKEFIESERLRRSNLWDQCKLCSGMNKEILGIYDDNLLIDYYSIEFARAFSDPSAVHTSARFLSLLTDAHRTAFGRDWAAATAKPATAAKSVTAATAAEPAATTEPATVATAEARTTVAEAELAEVKAKLAKLRLLLQ